MLDNFGAFLVAFLDNCEIISDNCEIIISDNLEIILIVVTMNGYYYVNLGKEMPARCVQAVTMCRRTLAGKKRWRLN